MANLSTPFSYGSARTADVVRPAAGVTAAVAERLISEGLISLTDASKLLPPVRGNFDGRDRRVSTSSIFRWIVRGKHGVYLEAIKLNGTAYWTSKPALARFATALTLATGPA